MADDTDDQYENGFYLAVVGDGDEGEPIRVQEGFWYSTGCADPHDMASVLIIRELDVSVPTKAQRDERAQKEAEEEAWRASLRQVSYEEYRVLYYRRHGWYPGHRRWPAPSHLHAGQSPTEQNQGESQ
jgi:hypothetical protein